MKVFISSDSLSIVKTEREKTFYQGSNYVDRIRVLLDKTDEDYSPTLQFKLPTGRRIGPVYPIGIDAGTTRLINEDGKTWYYYDFIISSDVGLLAYPGQLEASVILNYYNTAGTIIKQAVVGTVVNEVVKTTVYGDGNIIVVGEDPEAILNNLNLTIANLANRQSSIEAVWSNQTSKLISVIKNLLNEKSAYLEFSDDSIKVIQDGLELLSLSLDGATIKGDIRLSGNIFLGNKTSLSEKDVNEMKQLIEDFKSETRRKDFYEIDLNKVSNLRNIPKEAVLDYSGIFLKRSGIDDELLLKTKFSGIGSNITYIAFHISHTIFSTSYTFSAGVYSAQFDESNQTYTLVDEAPILFHKIGIVQNPTEENEKVYYPRVIRIDGVDYDLDFKKYTNESITASEARTKNYIEGLERVTYEEIEENYYNKNTIQELLGNISSLKFKIVDNLPDDPDLNTIYLTLSYTPEGEDDIYEERIFIDGKWEILGSTKVYMDDYVKKFEMAGNTFSAINNSATGGIDLNANNTEGNTSKLKLTPQTAELELNINGRKCSFIFLNGQAVLTSPDDGASTVQGGVVIIRSTAGGGSELSLTSDGAYLDGSKVINEDMLTKKLSNYDPSEEEYTEEELDEIIGGIFE